MKREEAACLSCESGRGCGRARCTGPVTLPDRQGPWHKLESLSSHWSCLATLIAHMFPRAHRDFTESAVLLCLLEGNVAVARFC